MQQASIIKCTEKNPEARPFRSEQQVEFKLKEDQEEQPLPEAN